MKKNFIAVFVPCMVLIISFAIIFTGCASSGVSGDQSAAAVEDGYYSESAKMAETTAAACCLRSIAFAISSAYAM